MDWGLARDYAARDVQTEDVAVTEAEWLAATDPEAMLDYLRGKASDRKSATVRVCLLSSCVALAHW
jgi:hypothetical protein